MANSADPDRFVFDSFALIGYLEFKALERREQFRVHWLQR